MDSFAASELLINFTSNSDTAPFDFVSECSSTLSATLHWSLTLIGSIASATTISLNLLVLLSILLVNSLQKPHNLLLFSLAISDLLVGSLVMPMLLYLRVFCGYWPLGSMTCKIWIAIDVICCTASISNMTAIAIDRYIAVSYPIGYRINVTKGKAIAGGICAWVAAGVSSIPALLELGNSIGQGVDGRSSTCQHTTGNPMMQVFGAAFGFFIPLSITIYVYFMIFRVISKKKKRAFKPTESFPTKNAARIPLTCITPHQAHASAMMVKSRETADRSDLSRLRKFVAAARKLYQENKGTTILSGLLLSFLVCWGPFFTMFLLGALSRLTGLGPLLHLPDLFNNCLLWLGYVNSTINPFLLCYLSKDFRVAFKEIVCCRCFLLKGRMREYVYKHQMQLELRCNTTERNV